MRYFAIIDGCSVNDIAEAEAGEVSGETYNYYLFTSRWFWCNYA